MTHPAIAAANACLWCAGATWATLEYPQADIRCITFGSPRVGNKAFKRAFQTLVGTSLRLVHGGDPVPVLPPAFV